MPQVGRALQFLGYAYLLRVPLLTWAVLMTLWAGSFHGSAAEPILRGVFDIASPQSSFFAALAKFMSVAVAVLLAGTSMGVSARLVICNAHMRFRSPGVELGPGLELMFRFVPFVSFAAVVGTALLRSEAEWAAKLPGVAAGIVLWYLLTVGARNFVRSFHSDGIAHFQAGGWLPASEPGYLDGITGTIQPRHLFATYQFSLALASYVVYCFASNRGQYLVPTLSLVVMMLTLFCWGLSGLAFFLDRHRVPLVMPLAAVALSSGFFQQGDYFYQGLPLPAAQASPLMAADILQTHARSPDSAKPIVLVATSGGGIQATAWAARVLTGLNEGVSINCAGAKSSFSRYVRLISAVSGGSVGAMYFAAAYENGEVNPASGQSILENAEMSSLDEVTWGLAYPDLIFGLLPWMKGISFSRGGMNTTDSGFIYYDRGRLLENSWRKRLPAAQRDTTLSDWRKDAASGARPAVIFNSTLVETGDRYLLATTDFAESNDNKAKREQYQGRWEFFKLYPESDLRIRTAARLSATFPFVTPAARMLRNDKGPLGPVSQDGVFFRPEPHAVDGGYYDNYGMVSLFDWLDNGLQNVPLRPKILIVEIRATAMNQRHRPESSSYGTLFQLTNPLRTLTKVRGTGQLSHNALDENLINRLYTPNISEVAFDFTDTDERGCPRREPLNWHLTPGDLSALKDAWEKSDAIQQNVARVRAFLQEESCPAQ